MRRWWILWTPLEMKFCKRVFVIGCCIRLHNYWIEIRIEVDQGLLKVDGLVKVTPGKDVSAPYIIESGVSIDNIHNNCHFPNLSSKIRVTVKADNRRREQVEAAIA